MDSFKFSSIKFDGKKRRSIIYDGERRKEPFRQYEVEHSDSSFYDRILPLVMEYYSAKQRNKEECF
ncbi:hypothetical protein IIW29_02280 [Candidatus Saccharibacteria bacterium]|nr:hypothetical protein [Candidatus Saccharibacteria bacterium]